MRSLLSKILRGLRRVAAGEMPHFLVRLIDKRSSNLWKRFEQSKEQEIVWRLGYGAKLLLHKSSSLCKIIITDSFERGERKLLRTLLRPGDYFVDVGANIGLFTVIAAHIVGKEGKVLAIEPSPLTCHKLSNQILLNQLNNVTIEQCGVSSQEGTLQLWQSKLNADAFNSFGQPIQMGDYEAVTVPVKTLSAIVRQNLGTCPVTLVKIDVEGWETHVLRGGADLLASQNAPTLIVEFCEKALKGSGSSCRELYDILKSYGYRLYLIQGYTGALSPLDHFEVFEYANILATKKRRTSAR